MVRTAFGGRLFVQMILPEAGPLYGSLGTATGVGWYSTGGLLLAAGGRGAKSTGAAGGSAGAGTEIAISGPAGSSFTASVVFAAGTRNVCDGWPGDEGRVR